MIKLGPQNKQFVALALRSALPEFFCYDAKLEVDKEQHSVVYETNKK